MSEVWQTIEQAAVTLGLSVRTVNRHITAGKLQSRLYEGRREVLVALPELVRKPDRSAFAAESAGVGRDGQPTRAQGYGEVGSETAYPFGVDGSPSARAAESDALPPDGSSDGRDSARQTVTAQVATDKPMDVQTMLALADSIDDKATLAIAAYQTLARSSETQVQSLRRVAFGAWAAVGLMAVGIIVAVGWVTQRWTTAEVRASQLGEKVTEKITELERVSAERDRTRDELRTVSRDAAQMARELKEVAVQAARQQVEAADMVKFEIRRMQELRPTTNPAANPATIPPTQPANSPATAASVNPWITMGSPATKPAASPSTPVVTAPATRPNEVGAGGPFYFNSPTSRPAAVSVPRPPVEANTTGSFGPR